jgi:ATP-dependent Lon protease
MKDNNWPQFKDNVEDIPSALYQRTEELYQIPDAIIGKDGLVELPALILRDVVIFPHMVAPIFISQGVNLQAINAAQADYSTLIALMVREQGMEDPKSRDFLPIGVEVAAGRLLSLSEGSHSALIQGRHRMQIVEFTQTDPYIKVKVRPIIESVKTDRKIEALMRTTRDLFERCVMKPSSFQ